MKIWHKILAAPAVAILFLLALGALSVVMMARQGLMMAQMVQARGGAMDAATSSSQQVAQVQVRVYHLLNSRDGLEESGAKAVGAVVDGRIDGVTKRLAEFGARPDLTAEERQVVDMVEPILAKYRKDIAATVALVLSDPTAAMQSMQEASTGFNALTKAFDDLVQVQRVLAKASTDQGARDFRNTVGAFIGIVLFAVVVSALIALLMARAITRPLRTAIGVAGGIARGDLTADIAVRGKDETADLLRALEQMKVDLRQLVGEVAGGAATVSDTSAQIAQGNLDLSQRTEEQASSLEETASSLEELTSTVNQNADNARQASVLAVSASDVARRGGAAVGEVVSTMTGISESSRRIGDIIGVIDGIAFQTNILALNAAVEAARAGEQGRGFAVVAAEVRNLAQRSAQAAREIKGLIGESIEKVDAGTRLVDAAGATMEEIVASVKKVSDLIAEIAAASQEQSSGIAQVNSAITQMDSVVQQNASLVEEATAATESMKSQAGALLQMVARFSLGEQAQAYVQPAFAQASAPPVAPARVATRVASRRTPRNAPALAPALVAPRQPDGQWTEF